MTSGAKDGLHRLPGEGTTPERCWCHRKGEVHRFPEDLIVMAPHVALNFHFL